MLTFKPAFSLCSFTFIKWLFSSSSLSAITVVSSAYLRLLIFFLAILIPYCASTSLVFLMMYSAYKLNKQCDNIQLCRTPFPIWNQSIVPCPALNLALCCSVAQLCLFSTPWTEAHQAFLSLLFNTLSLSCLFFQGASVFSFHAFLTYIQLLLDLHMVFSEAGKVVFSSL